MSTKPKLTIAFLGPDGSGKSTIISLLMKTKRYPCKKYFHLKPMLGSSTNNIPVTDPHKLKPYGKLLSFLKLIVFVAQYNYGWFKNVFMEKSSALIIFDRYFDDLIVDNLRYRYSGAQSVAIFMRKFVPRPDIYIVLTAMPEVIFARKKEVSEAELARQILMYKRFVDNELYFDLDASKSPERILSDVLAIIERKSFEFQ